jgi:hypothetical protein
MCLSKGSGITFLEEDTVYGFRYMKDTYGPAITPGKDLVLLVYTAPL